MEIEMQGLKELSKALDGLTEVRFRKRAMVSAGRKAMQPVLDDARSNAPVLSPEAAAKNPSATAGALKSDIKMSTKYNDDPKASNGRIKKNNEAELKVVVKTGKDTEDYAFIAEHGRDEFHVYRNQVFGKPSKTYLAVVAAMKPQPYMRPALESNVDRVLNRFYYEMGNAIHRQAKAQARHFAKVGKT